MSAHLFVPNTEEGKNSVLKLLKSVPKNVLIHAVRPKDVSNPRVIDAFYAHGVVQLPVLFANNTNHQGCADIMKAFATRTRKEDNDYDDYVRRADARSADARSGDLDSLFSNRDDTDEEIASRLQMRFKETGAQKRGKKHNYEPEDDSASMELDSFFRNSIL